MSSHPALQSSHVQQVNFVIALAGSKNLEDLKSERGSWEPIVAPLISASSETPLLTYFACGKAAKTSWIAGIEGSSKTAAEAILAAVKGAIDNHQQVKEQRSSVQAPYPRFVLANDADCPNLARAQTGDQAQGTVKGEYGLALARKGQMDGFGSTADFYAGIAATFVNER